MVKKLILKDKVSEYQEVESAEAAFGLFMDDNKVLGYMEGGELYVLLYNSNYDNHQWMNVDNLISYVPMSGETTLKSLESRMNRGKLLIFDDIADAKNHKGA